MPQELQRPTIRKARYTFADGRKVIIGRVIHCKQDRRLDEDKQTSAVAHDIRSLLLECHVPTIPLSVLGHARQQSAQDQASRRRSPRSLSLP